MPESTKPAWWPTSPQNRAWDLGYREPGEADERALMRANDFALVRGMTETAENQPTTQALRGQENER